MQKLRVLAVCLALMSAHYFGCQRTPQGVSFWSDTTSENSVEFSFDPQKQLEALRVANPEHAATHALNSGDRRLLGNRFFAPRFIGFPDEDLAESMRKTNGFKLVAATEELLVNEEFAKLKRGYEERFNKAMYDHLTKTRGTER